MNNYIDAGLRCFITIGKSSFDAYFLMMIYFCTSSFGLCHIIASSITSQNIYKNLFIASRKTSLNNNIRMVINYSKSSHPSKVVIVIHKARKANFIMNFLLVLDECVAACGAM